MRTNLRTRRGLATQFVVLALVGVLLAALVLGYATGWWPGGQTSSHSSCEISTKKVVPQFGPSSRNASAPGELVIIGNVNNHFVVCVGYSAPFATNITLAPQAGVGELQHQDGGVGLVIVPTSNISVTSESTSVAIPAGENVTVAYTISTSAQSRGFYFLDLSGICPSIPVSIGYEENQVSKSNFAAFGPEPCRTLYVTVSIVGLVGANSTYIEYR